MGSSAGKLGLVAPSACLSWMDAVDWPRGKSSRINPRSVQVDRLRYSLVAIGLMYIICRVSLPNWVSLILVSAAPMMGSWLPLADLIVSDTGIKSPFSRPRLLMSLGPARQLWHPVSASAVADWLEPSFLRVWPCAW